MVKTNNDPLPPITPPDVRKPAKASKTKAGKMARYEAQIIASQYGKPFDQALEIAKKLASLRRSGGRRNRRAEKQIRAELKGPPVSVDEPEHAQSERPMYRPYTSARPKSQARLNARNLKKENIRRSLAAGAAVGTFSELDKPKTSRKKKKRFKKLHKKSPNNISRGSQDALTSWRRVPGSFENGKRR